MVGGLGTALRGDVGGKGHAAVLADVVGGGHDSGSHHTRSGGNDGNHPEQELHVRDWRALPLAPQFHQLSVSHGNLCHVFLGDGEQGVFCKCTKRQRVNEREREILVLTLFTKVVKGRDDLFALAPGIAGVCDPHVENIVVSQPDVLNWDKELVLASRHLHEVDHLIRGVGEIRVFPVAGIRPHQDADAVVLTQHVLAGASPPAEGEAGALVVGGCEGGLMGHGCKAGRDVGVILPTQIVVDEVGVHFTVMLIGQ